MCTGADDTLVIPDTEWGDETEFNRKEVKTVGLLSDEKYCSERSVRS